jgi:hypothetical protein
LLRAIQGLCTVNIDLCTGSGWPAEEHGGAKGGGQIGIPSGGGSWRRQT